MAQHISYIFTDNNRIEIKVFVFSSGAYVPLTVDGNVVVDGVFASCSASVDPDLTQIGTTPIRYFPQITDWIFGENYSYTNIAQDLRNWVFAF